jgi:2-keto-3-deoxygluconate permease
MLARGLGIMVAKVGTATLFALAVSKLFGGSILGLSFLAVMVAMSGTNGGMFLALTCPLSVTHRRMRGEVVQ